MSSDRAQTRRSLSAEGLRRLLEVLDSDPDHAGKRYGELRTALTALFRFWGAIAPLELADRTLDRVALKLEEGTTVPREALARYARATARMIFHELQRELDREHHTLAELERNAVPDDSRSRMLDLLDGCLDGLAPADRTLLLDYYAAEGRTATQARQGLAVRIGTSWTALRLRMLRLRQKLEACVGEALKQ